MLQLKKIRSGEYVTSDGKITVVKDDGYWYAEDTKTGQSVVDCERTLREIKDTLEGYLSNR